MKRLVAICATVLLSACADTKTTIQISEPAAMLAINEDPPVLVDGTYSTKLSGTSFAQFLFKVTADNLDPMYGLLPQDFQGGLLAVDILFFMPAAFLNLRGVFPYYELDVREGVVRYKLESDDPWTNYTPTPAEIERAKTHFGD